MGQKVNPYGFRLGTLYDWQSNWYAQDKKYQKFLHQDLKLREFLKEELKTAGLVKTEIKRSINTVEITVYVSRPGVVIGRGGSRLKELKSDIHRLLKINPNKPKSAQVDFQVQEVEKPDLSAELLAQQLVYQIKRRYPHRRAVAKAIEKAMNAGAKGIKIVLAGRIAGAEIARTEKYGEGKVPLQTLRADIDYAQKPCLTKSGYVGIKVWVYKGEEEIE